MLLSLSCVSSTTMVCLYTRRYVMVLPLTRSLALDRCLELMAEDPERQRRRTYLVREKNKITKAQQWLATVRKEDQIVTPIKSQPPGDWAGLDGAVC